MVSEVLPDVSIILHICEAGAWREAQARGEYRAESLGTEGFIHCSTPEQVAGTANLLFRGRAGLVLLVIESDKVRAEIAYEAVGNGLIFPHVYGPLNLDAVVRAQDFAPAADGVFHPPVL